MTYNMLNQMKARSLDAGKYADGQGLWLVKRSRQAGKWILRLTVEGRRREMGLGPWPDVTIGEARERAQAARRRLRDGVDPIAEREQRRRKARRLSFGQAVEGCFAAKKASLKGGGKAGRWMTPLKSHVLPKIGAMAVEDVDQHVIVKTLEPLWHEKADTARKAMNRINLTLQHAAALGLDVDLQAALKAKALLGKQRHAVEHIPSLPYPEVTGFYRFLTGKEAIAALALQFLILTVARTSEVRLARFDEIEGGVWTLSPERTKTEQEHRIPLTGEALRIVALARKRSDGDHLFPAPRGKPISDMAMSVFMKREGFEARPHGFRATFRTWVEEQTDAPYEVKEAALGHRVDSGVVRAYQRSDRLEKRRELMERWSAFVTDAEAASGARASCEARSGTP